MIYSIFAWMCYYAMFTSCAWWYVQYEDWDVAIKDVDYCNFMYHDLWKFDSDCVAICTEWDFYSDSTQW